MLEKQEKRYRRHKRVRAKIKGTDTVPRLCVFKSSKHIYSQLVDDEKGRILTAASDLEFKKQRKKAGKKSQASSKKESMSGKVIVAFAVGKLVAEKALKKQIKKVVFDRGGYAYQGRVRALAEGAREGGLKF